MSNLPLPLKTTPQSPHEQAGLSLVEIMIAVTLSLVLIAGIIQIYAGNKQTNTLQSDLVQLQDSVRFSLELLSRDLRMADSAGCIRLDAARASNRVNNMLTTTPAVLSAGGIQGWEAANTGTGTSATLSNVDLFSQGRVTVAVGTDWLAADGGNPALDAISNAVPQSDILRVWFAGRNQRPIADVSGNTINLTANAGIGAFEDGDIVMLSDCERIDIIQVCAGSSSNAIEFGCAENDGSLTVDPGTAIAYRLDTATYYVGKATTGTAAKNPPTLYRRSTAGVEPIAEGVENLQIIYGVDTLNGDGIPDRYVPASDVANWSDVVNVKLSVLMATLNKSGNHSADQTEYELNGFKVTPIVDGRLRRVFTTSVALRNRV